MVTEPRPAAPATLARPGPGSMAWRIQRERLMLLSWGRAILLQFAHPLVAAGVAEHSAFSDDPRANRARLHRTIQAMLDLTFGPDDVAARAAARINGIHDRVAGWLDAPVGIFAAGTPYSAHMPDLLLWVYATLIDSSLQVYERFVGPLTPGEQDQFCADGRALGPWLGIPVDTMPDSRAALAAYMAAMVASGQITVGPTGRRLGRRLVAARPAWPVRGPLLRALHWPTVGLLPTALRKAYGLTWTPADAAGLAMVSAASRRLLPLTPPAARYWPTARRATRARAWRAGL
ncbi:MAG: DUF2236 domain-containing protein [Chloroflexi bacterium]|nr:DUF2236 domain-containing protein [Chloroflexota bacterium]